MERRLGTTSTDVIGIGLGDGIHALVRLREPFAPEVNKFLSSPETCD
jgi:hypothetical protein